MNKREFRMLARQLRAGAEPRRKWWWRLLDKVLRYLPELLSLAALVWAWQLCVHRLGALLTAGIWAGVLGVALGWPRSRRWVLTGVGLAVTRFRLRTGLVQLRLTNLAGRLPLVLWIVPTPVGERVWLWCRAGISAEDIAAEIDGLRAACVARDLRVTRDPRWAALVVLDVIRRDRLAPDVVIPSQLIDGAGRRQLGRGRRRRWWRCGR